MNGVLPEYASPCKNSQNDGPTWDIFRLHMQFNRNSSVNQDYR